MVMGTDVDTRRALWALLIILCRTVPSLVEYGPSQVARKLGQRSYGSSTYGLHQPGTYRSPKLSAAASPSSFIAAANPTAAISRFCVESPQRHR